MNKYFLSFITVLIIIQLLFLIDDIFFPKTKQKNVYSIIPVIESFDDNTDNDKNEKKSNKEMDFNELFLLANIDNGKRIVKQCSGCHDLGNNPKIKVGPPLWNIVGRKSASIGTFGYSESFKNFKQKWTIENLYFFLESPKNYIQGTKMKYKGLKKSRDRVDLIQYLKTLK